MSEEYDKEFKCMTLNLEKIVNQEGYCSFTKSMAAYLYFNEVITAGDFIKRMNYWDLLQAAELCGKTGNDVSEEFMVLVLLCARGETLTFTSYEEVSNGIAVFKKLLGIGYAHISKRIKDVDYSKMTLEMPVDYNFESLYTEIQ